MKIIVLHGDNKDAIQERLVVFVNEAKKRKYKIVRMTWEGVIQYLRNIDLFEEGDFVLIDGLKGFTKKESDYLIKSSHFAKTIVVLVNSNLTNLQMTKFPKNTVFENFTLPKILFPFLDAIAKHNAKETINKLNGLVQTQNIEVIFALLVRRVRDLIWVKASPSDISYPSWIVAELEVQSAKFSYDQLENMLLDLLKIDLKAKSSTDKLLPMLDDFFFNHLQ